MVPVVVGGLAVGGGALRPAEGLDGGVGEGVVGEGKSAAVGEGAEPRRVVYQRRVII